MVNTTKFQFSWSGVSGVGFADGDAVVAAFDNDSATQYAGVKGEGEVVIGNSRMATFTVRVQGSSPAAKKWMAIDLGVKTGEITDTAFIYKKLMGNNDYVCTGTCTLKRKPMPTSNREMPILEFIFGSSDTEAVIV